MGMCPMRRKNVNTNEDDEYKKLVHRLRLLEQEIAIVMSQREEENKAYEREVFAFSFKEAEWKRERKKLRDELKRLQRKETSKIRVLGNEDHDKLSEKEKDGDGECCVEKMRQERARRDEAVEKWKMLYLAIKAELDDLIQRTTLQGGGLYWRAEEEDFMEDIQKEINVKDETIDTLRAKVASLEEEEYKSKREVDILRQSLRIMCSKKKVTTSKYGC